MAKVRAHGLTRTTGKIYQPKSPITTQLFDNCPSQGISGRLQGIGSVEDWMPSKWEIEVHSKWDKQNEGMGFSWCVLFISLHAVRGPDRDLSCQTTVGSGEPSGSLSLLHCYLMVLILPQVLLGSIALTAASSLPVYEADQPSPPVTSTTQKHRCFWSRTAQVQELSGTETS